ncbi:MAG: energy-coupling factor transporter transmembrane protein EcfT [bacterium]|nr:energy-coupling factor transporter transmembrane protein EcfT [bacterium]
MLFTQEIHPSRLDAGVRIAAIFVPALLIGFSLNPSVLLLLSAFAVALVIIVRVPIASFAKIALPALIFCSITLVMHLLFSQSPDSSYFKVGPLSLNQLALNTGLLYCWRIVLFFLIALCFSHWIGQEELAELVWRTIAPLRKIGIPAQEIGLALTIAIRFIPQIFSEHHRIEMAQRARGANFSKNRFGNVRRFVPMLVPTVASALRRIDTTTNALTVRAWGVYPSRTFHRRRHFGLGDAVMLLAVVAVVAGVGYLSR